ncbi:MAG: PqqD family peptide modification chaperone [Lentisphaeria bacterium]|nr:PqqD family peptide modification chaperone [Lentisphaeria bacterium]
MEVNKNIIFRKEFDGSALLFDPESGETFGLNQTSAFLWEQFAAGADEAQALEALKAACNDLPADAEAHIAAFAAALQKKKFLF